MWPPEQTFQKVGRFSSAHFDFALTRPGFQGSHNSPPSHIAVPPKGGMFLVRFLPMALMAVVLLAAILFLLVETAQLLLLLIIRPDKVLRRFLRAARTPFHSRTSPSSESQRLHQAVVVRKHPAVDQRHRQQPSPCCRETQRLDWRG
jgi:hypothetical protein